MWHYVQEDCDVQKALWSGCIGDELQTLLCALARVFDTCIKFISGAIFS
jgi:hypothetical protein